ncbi:MAG: RibD family protein [Chloroflexota bacterium]
MGVIPIDLLLADAKRHRERFGRPLVTLSYAQSLDGSIAACRGSPLSLSGSESMILTHRLRAAHGAVLVGIGTVLADNPRLNVRLVDGSDPQPIILDSRLRFPLDSSLLSNESLSPWIITTPHALRERQYILEAVGARVLHMPSEANGWVDLNALLKALAASGISSLMVEGGARVITSFLHRRLVDRLVLTITPTIVGGLHAVEAPLFSGSDSMSNIAHSPRLQDLGYEQSGADIVIWATLAWEAE